MRKMDCWRAKWMFSCPIKLYAVGDGGTVITHRALRRSPVVEFFSKLKLCRAGRLRQHAPLGKLDHSAWTYCADDAGCLCEGRLG